VAERDEASEWNFDGLVGPTYNHSATAPGGPGNFASQANRGRPTNPKAAALEGLKKAETVMRLGVRQAVLPPLLRPNLTRLYRMGLIQDPGLLRADDFGALAAHLARRANQAPHVLAACFSGSSVWTANWATVSPSIDTGDGKVHFTPANQSRSFHRSMEAEEVYHLLKQVFPPGDHFAFHEPLPATYQTGDEGAANHLRLASHHGSKGVNIFIYGRGGFEEPDRVRVHLPRQTLEASRAVARLHGLDPYYTLYVRQNPLAIDAGIFHNDVISTVNLDLFFYHELAFADRVRTMSDISEAFRMLTDGKGTLRTIEVGENEVPIGDASVSYLFNSQLVNGRDGSIVLIAPRQCEFIPTVRRFLDTIQQRKDGMLDNVVYADVPSSMRSGGGPACLRLRVVLTPEQEKAISGRVILDDDLLGDLRDFIEHNYPTDVEDRLFMDASFLKKCFETSRGLYEVLDLSPATFDEIRHPADDNAPSPGRKPSIGAGGPTAQGTRRVAARKPARR
jgi:succinylarginine dihydrolase